MRAFLLLFSSAYSGEEYASMPGERRLQARVDAGIRPRAALGKSSENTGARLVAATPQACRLADQLVVPSTNAP